MATAFKLLTFHFQHVFAAALEAGLFILLAGDRIKCRDFENIYKLSL